MNHIFKIILCWMGWLLPMADWACSYDFVDNGIYYKIGALDKMEVAVTQGEDSYKGNVVLPATVHFKGYEMKVTKVDDMAFRYCYDLLTLDLGEVTEVGARAFDNCTQLTSVNMRNVTKLGDKAFYMCGKLADIDLKNMTELGSEVFWGCRGITSVDLDNVTKMGTAVFARCSSLESVHFGKFKMIPDMTFMDCTALKDIDFEQVTYIGSIAFSRCTGIETLNLAPVEQVGEKAFEGCKSLRQVSFGKIKRLPGRVFAGCEQLTSIDLGGVTDVWEEAFQDCSNLKEIKFGMVRRVGRSAFQGCRLIERLDFEQVQTIEESVFQGCTNLKTVDFGTVQTVRSGAFSGCTGLTSLDFRQVRTIGRAFTECTGLQKIHLRMMEGIGNQAFWGCRNLSEIRVSATKPPHPNSGDIFDKETFLTATLYVPQGYKGLYEGHGVWGDFFHMVEEPAEMADTYPVVAQCNWGGVVKFGQYTASTPVTGYFRKGEVVEVTAVPDPGFELKELTVNGKAVETDGGRYRLLVDEACSVLATFEALPLCLSIQQADNGTVDVAVEKGKSYTVFVRAAEGWKVNTVTFNGRVVTDLLDAGSRYVTPEITVPSVLNVTFELENPSAVGELAADDLEVRGDRGCICVKGARRGDDVKVYTVTGALMVSETSTGNGMRIRVEEHQVYIVKVGDRTFKLSL